MKKFVIPALFLAAASAAAVPAAAQSYGPQHYSPQGYGSQHYGPDRGPDRGYGSQNYNNPGYNNWQSIAHRKVNLDRRIEQGVRTRQLSRREASRLQVELDSLIRLERSYMRGGLSRAERNDLDRRYDRLSAQIRYERRDNDGRRW